MGESGSGKSSLLYTVNNIIPSFFKGIITGSVSVNDAETKLKRIPELSKEIGFVFQDFDSQLFSTKAELDVAFGLENLLLDDDEIYNRIDYYGKKLKLSHLLHKDPSLLSGGQKQKLSISCILAMQPKILLCDEPTTDLDPISKAEVMKILVDSSKMEGKTLAIAEHETEFALHFSKLCLLKNGEVIFFGPPESGLRNLDLLRDTKIRPLQVTELFEDSGLEESMLPISVDEALYQMSSLALTFNKEINTNLISHSNKTVIEIKNLHYQYDNSNFSLKDVNITIQEGCFTSIMGQNGSGKSTIIKLIMGLLDPQKGEIILKGKNRKNITLDALSKDVGFLFQNPDHQIFNETIFDELVYGLEEIEEEELIHKVKSVLQIVNLEGKESVDPFSLTRGEKQKLALASILIREPKVLILDEPTTGLDYHEQLEVLKVIKELHLRGHTIILITHSNWITAEYAEEVILFHEGKVIEHGKTRKVFSDPNLLLSARVTPPQITELGYQFGVTLLSVREAKNRLLKKKEGVYIE